MQLFSNHLTLGYRRDGRRHHEIRKVECKLSVTSNANGSALFNIGNTSVLVSVFGPQNPKNREARASRDAAVLSVRCNTASFSSTTHRDPGRNRRGDRQLSNLIKSTFDAIVMRQLYPRCTIDIVIETLQNDGGNISAAINATTLALIDAGIALQEYCVSCSAGYIDGGKVPLLDLNYLEQTGTGSQVKRSFKAQKLITTKSRYNQKPSKQIKKLMELEKAEKEQEQTGTEDEAKTEEAERSRYCSGQLTLAVMPVSNQIITMQMQSIIDVDKMKLLLQCAQRGCKDIHKIMKNAVKAHSFEMMQHRGFINR